MGDYRSTIRLMLAANYTFEQISYLVDLIERADARQRAISRKPCMYTLPEDEGCYVYVMESDSGLIKIGISKHPKYRAYELSRGRLGKHYIEHIERLSSRQLAFDVEQWVHARLRRLRCEGEYFAVDPRVAVDLVCEGAAKLAESAA